MALIGRNTRIEVQKTIGAAVPISAISNANPGVVQFGGTAPANGDVIVISDAIEGMLELAGQTARVAALAGSPINSFELERINTTLFGAMTGTSSFKKVSAWSTLGVARSMDAGSPASNRIDRSALIDPVKRYLMGQPDTPEISVGMISNPLAEAVELVEEAAYSGAQIAFRITLQDGSKRVFGGFVTAPSESIPLGELITSGFSIVQVGRRLAFAS